MTSLLGQSLIEPSIGLIFWKTIAFLLFLYVLYKFGWGPITEAMEAREEEIESSIQRAEEALEEAKEIQAENKEARREAEKKAQRILREAREAAEELREEQKAQAEIEREKQAALQELRDEVADLAIEAASKVVQEDLDDDRQRRIVNDFIADLPQN